MRVSQCGVVALTTLVVLVSLVSAAAAAPVPFPLNASGSNARFGWSNGSYTTGNFGSPSVDTAGFHFNNLNFRADGMPTTQANDNMDITVNVAAAIGGPAAPLPTITIVESGRYFSPNGHNDFFDVYVQATTSLTGIQPIAGTAGPVALGVTFNPVDSGLGYGTWSAEFAWVPDAGDPEPMLTAEWSEVTITVVNNTFQLTAGSWIEKDRVDVFIPEPAALLLMVGGLGCAALRRRRD